ncbi:helix-turn-helix transcriptional regulator [Gordonia phosphorivorans]|uniref:Helix-turn-helix transcriptional regulator n=1 Tax=Gordonia phosphorivorans TaxID=1056982 RepID=A0ABV6H4G2_9ACTN
MAVQTVGVVIEHDLSDRALVELVSRCGYRPVLLDFEQPSESQVNPVGAVLVRDVTRLRAVAADARCVGARIAVVLSHQGQREVMVPRGVTVIPATDDAPKHLRAFFTEVLGEPRPVDAVSLSPREREVLTTYVMGATVEEVARQHFLSTSTVRTHYRRASNRYFSAGRPVTNKSHLLLQMVADGWIELPGRDGGAAASN